MLVRAFQRVVLARRWLSFTVLCVSFLAFGVGTLNLIGMFRMNIDLIAEHGTMALTDGAAQQLIELLLTLLGSMAAYVVFKACEYSLVHGLTDRRADRTVDRTVDHMPDQMTHSITKEEHE